MRLRFILLWAPLGIAACSSSDFAVNAENDGATSDTSTSASDTNTTPSADAVSEDSATVVADGGCAAIDHSATTVFVDANAELGGKGSSGCPFRTLAEAASAPLGSGVTRVVSVRTGTYNETSIIQVRTGESYRSDGSGLVKVSGKSTAMCASGDSCTFQLAAGAALDGLLIEGGTAANGIVASATAGNPPLIKNTTVKAAPKDGIVVLGVGASLGPNTHADANGWSGMMIRAGRVSVAGLGNTFNGNKGGVYIGSTYVAGSGIHVKGGAGLSIDGGTQANSNANGIFFDAGGSSGTQTISQVTAASNRSIGVHVAKGWQVLFRKSNLNNNGTYGLLVSFDEATSVDLGTTGMPGGNIFGGSTVRNGKAGIFLCRSRKTASLIAEGNNWVACPPTQGAVGNCDTAPSAYVDVAYVPEINATDSVDPLALPTACTRL